MNNGNVVKKVDLSDLFMSNADFSAKLRQFRIPMASLDESEGAATKSVVEERGHHIDACSEKHKFFIF